MEDLSQFGLHFLEAPHSAPVSVGSTRQAVESAFGPPETHSAGFSSEHAPIWKYAGIEFHFKRNGGCVFLVHADEPRGISALTGGIEAGATIGKVSALLAAKGVEYSRHDSGIVEGTARLDLRSGVALYFSKSNEEPTSELELHAVAFGGEQKIE